MTIPYKETIEILEMFLHKQCDLARTEFAYSQSEVWEAVKISKNALEEVEQYRALGTVEELKETRKKQIPKTPCIEGDGYADGHLVYDTWICPNCEEHYEIDYDDYDYCPKCGQAINKSVFEGSEEDD